MLKEKVFDTFSDIFKPKAYKFFILSIIAFVILVTTFDKTKTITTKCEIHSYKGSFVHKVTDNSGNEKYYTIKHKYTVRYNTDGYKDVNVKQSVHERVVKNKNTYLYVYEEEDTEYAGLIVLGVIFCGIVFIVSMVAMLEDA